MRVAVSGYFDPLHVGHLELIDKAKEYGDVVILLNNDHQATLKKGRPFMPENERKVIMEHIKGVSEVIICVDTDRSVKRTLEHANIDIFANGGDRTNDEIPEAELCKRENIVIIDNLGEKIQSSSELIAKDLNSKAVNI